MHKTTARDVPRLEMQDADNCVVVAPDNDPLPAPIIAVTVADAARITGIGKTTLYERMGNGSLPFAKVGRRVVIPFGGLTALIAANIVPPKSRAPSDEGASS